LTFGFVQIDKYYQQLKGATASGVSSSSIDIGDIPADGFAWPVDLNQSPNSAVVGYLYGYTNAYGGNHTGIDIRNGGTLSNQGNFTVGPTIVAAHDGVVEEAKLIYTSNSSGIDGNQSGYGNVVKIKTEDGKFMTVYGHLSTISVITGQKVTRGQVIGTMGTTGNSSGVHLHYEIRQDGSTKDPLLFYTTDPVYGSYPTREDTPAGYYRYTGSISSGISNTAASAGLLGFLTSFEGEGPKVGDKYQAYDDGFGNITIGAGITWKDHKSQFNAAGIYSMAEGDLVDIAIVDNIKKNDIAGRVANIKSVLESNGITDLKQYQIDALTSFHYNVGNIDDFPAAWKKYGTGEGLWTEFFSKHIYASGEVVQGLVNRRRAEFELFTTGNYGL
jgi:GH24 family phage-related lysozyme (muramidase)